MIAAHAASQTLYAKPPPWAAHFPQLAIEPVDGTSAKSTKFLNDEVAMSR